jgi:hypothetical protein
MRGLTIYESSVSRDAIRSSEMGHYGASRELTRKEVIRTGVQCPTITVSKSDQSIHITSSLWRKKLDKANETFILLFFGKSCCPEVQNSNCNSQVK